MSAIALTDNGNLFGAMEFTKKAIENKIKPILGAIVTVEFKDLINKKKNYYNVTLLITDNFGWKNLSHLVSNSYLNLKTNNKRHVSYDDLINYKRGLILLFNDINKAKIIENDAIEIFFLKDLKKEFKDKLYLDLFREDVKDKSITEANLLKASYIHDIPLVCTNNISFLTEEMYEAHDCLMCINQSTTITDDSRYKVNKQSFFKSTTEMISLFVDMPETLENTVNVAKRCNFILTDSKPKLPSISLGSEVSEERLLENKAKEGLYKKVKELSIGLEKEILDQRKKTYFDRLNYEIKIITEMGYAGYFLIVSDFIIWAKKKLIPVGPGRGSGAGSIVAWCLNITDLDPIKYGLLFERFLNPDRISLPDFDIDFCKHRREEVIEYVRNKYGENKVAQIITFGSLQARAVIRDIGRVLGFNYGRIDKIAKLIPNNPGSIKELSHLVKNDITIKNLINEDNEIAKLFDISIKLEGLNRNASTHAAGLVISNSPIVEDVPLYFDSKSYLPATQFSMKYLEKIGLIKFDFLGLETLSVLDATVKLLRLRGINIKLDNIALNDKKTFDTLSSGNTLGVFQLESIPMRQVLKQLRPDRIEDIIAVVALYRPGPMEQIPAYINRKHNNKLTTYPHPLLEKLLKETHGIMIYQEQVMEAARVIAGFSLAKADLLRRAMGKKIKSEMQDLKDSFIHGSSKNNINEAKAKKIFSDIEKFAGYGFNKSHAAAYAIISYQTAWCKTHYPEEFFTSLLNSEINNSHEKYTPIKSEIEKLGKKILISDINKSNILFSVERNKEGVFIRSGLANIKNIGYELAKHIVNERNNNGKFKSLIDFFSRINPAIINKRQIEFLSMAGVFDQFHLSRSTIYGSASNLLMISQNVFKDDHSTQQMLFTNQNNDENFQHLIIKTKDWTNEKFYLNEFSALGFLASGNPLEDDLKLLKNFNLSNSLDIEGNDINGKVFEILVYLIKYEHKTRANSKFTDLYFIDSKGAFNIRVYQDNIDDNNVLFVEGKTYVISVIHFLDRDNRMRIRFKSIVSVNDLKINYFKYYKIYLNSTENLEELKDKLTSLEEGNKKVNLIYNNVEISSGFSIDSNVNLENLAKNIKGVKNIEKFM